MRPSGQLWLPPVAQFTYRARDQLRNDFVALKLLHDQGMPNLDSERFDREAQLLSELRHPGIVSSIAHGIAPMGQRFLAMQWLDGEDLAHRLCRGPLPLGASLNLTLRIAEALWIRWLFWSVPRAGWKR